MGYFRFRLSGFAVASFALIAVFALLMLSTASSMSAFFDEPTTVALGYYTLKTSDFRMTYLHPAFGFEVLAWPLLFAAPDLPPDAERYVDYSYLAFVRDFYSSSTAAGSDKIIFDSRLVSIAFGIGVAVLVLLWALRLYGKPAALLALAIFAFNPVVLGNFPVVSNDVPLAFFFVLSAFLFWRFVEAPSALRLLAAAAALSFAIMAKLSGLFLLPAFFLLWFLCWKGRKFPLRLNVFGSAGKLRDFALLMAVFGVVFLIVGFALYRAQLGTVAENLPVRNLERMLSFSEALPDPVSSLADFAVHAPVPFPSFFVSLASVVGLSAFSEKTSFLFGEIYHGGKWQYFVLEFLLKTPIPLLLLMLLAVFSLRKLRPRSSEFFVIIPPLAYFAIMLNFNENFSIRHLLPVYPFLAIFSARVLKAWQPRRLVMVALPLLAWLLFSVAAVHPNHFAYFNELAGGSENGYKVMVANVDQGQALKEFKQYMEDGSIINVKFSYFGNVDPSLYGINYSYLPAPFWQAWSPVYAPSASLLPANYSEGCGKVEGVIAVSVTNLQGVHLLNRSCFSWLSSYEPVAVIGHSIFVYNISE